MNTKAVNEKTPKDFDESFDIYQVQEHYYVDAKLNGEFKEFKYGVSNFEGSLYLIFYTPNNDPVVKRYSSNGQNWTPQPFKNTTSLRNNYLGFLERVFKDHIQLL